MNTLQNYESMLKEHDIYYIRVPMRAFKEYAKPSAHKNKLLAFMRFIRDDSYNNTRTYRRFADLWKVNVATAYRWVNEFKDVMKLFDTKKDAYTKLPIDFTMQINNKTRLVAFVDYMSQYLQDIYHSQNDYSRRWNTYSTQAKYLIYDFKIALKTCFFAKQDVEQNSKHSKPLAERSLKDIYNSYFNREKDSHNTLYNNYNNSNNNFSSNSYCIDEEKASHEAFLLRCEKQDRLQEQQHSDYVEQLNPIEHIEEQSIQVSTKVEVVEYVEEFKEYIVNILNMRNVQHAIKSLLDKTHRHHERNKSNYKKFVKIHKRHLGSQFSQKLHEAGYNTIFDVLEEQERGLSRVF